MAKISALTDGATPTGSTDVFPVARSGANRKLSVGSFPIVLAKWGVPVILASSGSMANNGAVSGMTALPTTYSGGAWLYLPAGAVAAGVPAAAAFLWFVGSSTTAGTVYNSTWDGTGIPPLGTTTAFATTGPGAFTGVAAGEILAATVTIPAGAMGPTGALLIDAVLNMNSAAGNKNPRVRLGGIGGTSYQTASLSTAAYGQLKVQIHNAGLAAVQKGQASGFNISTNVVYGAIDTASTTTLVFTLEKATATNHVMWEGAVVQVVYGS